MPAPSPSSAKVRAALEAFKAIYPNAVPALDIRADGSFRVSAEREGDDGAAEDWGDNVAA